MAFLVEDGTGIKGANSYATVEFMKAYGKDRGFDVNFGTTASQRLLIQATDYIDKRWSSRFKGSRQFTILCSRAVLSFVGQPVDGETVTFGSIVYTFQTTPALTDDVEIGSNTAESLANLISVIATSDNPDYAGAIMADLDSTITSIYSVQDGTPSTETGANMSFDAATTSGKSGYAQPLAFPRQHLRDGENKLVIGIPDNLKEATVEYAIRANTSVLDPDPSTDASGNKITTSKTKVGPIDIQTQFSENISTKITKSYPAADRLLKGYVLSGGVTKL